MAGGVGTRFWPLSTIRKPKQFLRIFDDRSLIQKCYDRLKNIIPQSKIFILTNQEYTRKVNKHLPEIPKENIIGEPFTRDTGPAICLGSLIVKRRFKNAISVILPTDHLIQPVHKFQEQILAIEEQIQKESALYTIGIEPNYPATEYGYLEVERESVRHNGLKCAQVKKFEEKPNISTALKYFKSGVHLWNSAIYMWKVDDFLPQIKKNLPNYFNTLSTTMDYYGNDKWEKSLWNAYRQFKPVSLEYAIMEKLQNFRCVYSKFVWNDVGNWPSLKHHLRRDIHNNYSRGQVYMTNANNNFVFCEDDNNTVVLIGVEDLMVVRSGDKTLIMHKNHTSEIKPLIKSMQNELDLPVSN
jgi:mannose-1-phosphate guanylyltransferase